MDRLGDERERAHRARPDAGDGQQFGEIARAACRGRREIAMQAARVDVLGADVVMGGHDEMRQQRLLAHGRRSAGRKRILSRDRVRTERLQHRDLAAPRGVGAAVGEIDDLALLAPVDRRMRLLDEVFQALRQPVIAARLTQLAVHALLHHRPFAVVGDEETVQVEVEAVLHGGAVDLGDEPARLRQRRAVEADALADRDELAGGLARMGAAAAADVQAELLFERAEAALQRADDAGGDARGMPVHPHHGAKGLEPEGMREAAQQFVAAVMMDDRLAQDRAEARHACREPLRHAPAMLEAFVICSSTNRARRPNEGFSAPPWGASSGTRRGTAARPLAAFAPPSRAGRGGRAWRGAAARR